MIAHVKGMGEDQATKLNESEERAVLAELNRLLESGAFRTSKRCREFLGYIVEHTIRGPSGALKERSIGVELFQLPLDFDTGQHTIVRVTANEVRKKLAQHYLAENGAHHPIKIDLPPGSYSASFRWGTVAPETQIPATAGAQPDLPGPADAEPQVPEMAGAVPQVPEMAGAEPQVSARPGLVSRPNWLSRPALACATAVLVIGGVFAWWRWSAVRPISADTKSSSVPGAVPNALIGGEDLRMIVGSANPYIDRNGRTWSPDRSFSGGSVLVRPSAKIVRTLDPDIYRHLRQGDFRYDIPLKPGSYELHLHFAETGLADFISAESSVSANGNQLLDFFDVVADAAGSNVSDERVFRNVSPSEDGFLHLSFSSLRGTAMLSGIEVLPVSAGKVRPVRIRAGWTASWQDSAGQQWQADSYFLGGNGLVRTTNPAQESNPMAPELALYASERWGHFSYAVPVAEGRYRVTLKFCEGHYGRRNAALLRNFDIFKEAGGEGRPLDRTFSGIRPTAQGKIVLSFVPINGMACVNGVEVVEDSK
jgi:hypothetical protein